MFVCLLVSPTRDDGAARRHLRSSFVVGERRWRCAQKLCDCFLMLFGKLLTTVLRVRRACQLFKKRIELQLQREKRMIHSEIVWAWPAAVRVALEHRGCVFHHRSCLAAKKTREAIVVRIRFMRTTIRKEADLECDATARMFQVVLENVLRNFC